MRSVYFFHKLYKLIVLYVLNKNDVIIGQARVIASGLDIGGYINGSV